MGWDSRLAWSGEVPLSWPGLGPVALQRFSDRNGVEFADAVDPERIWQAVGIEFVPDVHTDGRWGKMVGFNRVNPATEQGRVTLPYFEGLWPSSGRLLIGLWLQHNYTMGFTPFLSTRGGSSPLVYLSGYSAGNLRHGVYNASGGMIGDQSIGAPWGVTLRLPVGRPVRRLRRPDVADRVRQPGHGRVVDQRAARALRRARCRIDGRPGRVLAANGGLLVGRLCRRGARRASVGALRPRRVRSRRWLAARGRWALMSPTRAHSL